MAKTVIFIIGGVFI